MNPFVMSLKSIAKGLLPYLVVERYRKNHPRDRFEDGFGRWLKTAGKGSFDKEPLFDTIVSVQGFGYSGSGAIIDFLREVPSVKVLGYVDKADEGGVFVPDSMKLSEIDIIRLAGGLFEIEKYLDSDNYFLNDALLNRTTRLFFQSELYGYSDRMRELMYRFFASITSVRMDNLSQVYYNTHTVTDTTVPNSIYFLKKMSKDEYVTLCRDFLTSVFNMFADKETRILACDQLFSDGENNMLRNREYVPNLKTIFVVRDPRDTYVWAVERNIEWMAHDTVDQFIEWYRIIYRNVCGQSTDDCLVIRYENLVRDYDTEEKRIREFLGLKDGEHSLRRQYFNPDYSSRFVGISKERTDLKDDLMRIGRELSEYCNPLID